MVEQQMKSLACFGALDRRHDVDADFLSPKMRRSSLIVDFQLIYIHFSRAHHEELVNMSWVDWWEDVKGQESFPVNAGFEFTMQGLLVQEHNYSDTTHTSKPINTQHMNIHSK